MRNNLLYRNYIWDFFHGDVHHPSIHLLRKSRITREQEERIVKNRIIKIEARTENGSVDLDVSCNHFIGMILSICKNTIWSFSKSLKEDPQCQIVLNLLCSTLTFKVRVKLTIQLWSNLAKEEMQWSNSITSGEIKRSKVWLKICYTLHELAGECGKMKSGHLIYILTFSMIYLKDC